VLGEEDQTYGDQRMGARKKKVYTMLSDKLLTPKLLTMWVRMVGTNYFARFCFGAARQRTSVHATKEPPQGTYPPICDILNPWWSPLTVMHQFWSACLVANSEWQRLILEFVDTAEQAVEICRHIRPPGPDLVVATRPEAFPHSRASPFNASLGGWPSPRQAIGACHAHNL
jgi:hypothetical protein